MSSTSIPLAAVAGDTTFPPIIDTFWPDFKEEVENDEQNLRLRPMTSIVLGFSLADTCCGHPAIGMQAPLDKKSFSHVPPVLSKGGLEAIKCGLCEARSALKYLRAVAELDPPRMKRGKRMNLSIRANPMWCDIVYQDNHHKVVERKDNEALYRGAMEYKEVPKTVRDLWEQYVKDWSEQAQQL
ncbi:hypothetical protein ACHAO7_009348 [Fusarium culmorum]